MAYCYQYKFRLMEQSLVIHLGGCIVTVWSLFTLSLPLFFSFYFSHVTSSILHPSFSAVFTSLWSLLCFPTDIFITYVICQKTFLVPHFLFFTVLASSQLLYHCSLFLQHDILHEINYKPIKEMYKPLKEWWPSHISNILDKRPLFPSDVQLYLIMVYIKLQNI